MDQHQESITRTRSTSFEAKSSSQSKRDHWSPIINAWRDSGLSQSAFCRKNKLNRPQFTYWRAKILAKPNVECHPSKGSFKTSPFVPVHALDTQSKTGLRVSLPNGVILSGIDKHNVGLLKTIVQAL